MDARRYNQSRKQPVWFSPYLLALVLSPMLLQTSTPLSCGPTGISTLSALEVEVMGTNEIAFDTAQRNYDVWLPVSASTAIVRATSSSVLAQVSYRLSHDGVLIEGGWLGTGSGEVTIPLEPGLNTLRVWGKSDGGASSQYTVAIQVGCSQCSDGNECTADTCDPVEEMCVYPPVADGAWCDFGGLPGVCVAGLCEEDLCDGIDCDDGNECTEDLCSPSNGLCENTAVQDGTPCAADRGGCYGGSCNFVPVSVTLGAKEVVFDWTTDRCENLDLPDNSAKVVRAEDGELVLFANNAPVYRVSRGPDFDTLQHVCDPPALVSADLPTPESYENNEWLWSPYREGTEWHVLIHNEFHPPGPLPCDGNNCWYNSITYAMSVDDARSFVKPNPPAHVVAPAPNLWTPPPPNSPVQPWYAEGYFEPSNIVLGPGDYYYTGFRAMDWETDTRGTCVMRTKTLADPASWRAWDGSGFNLRLDSPYVTGTATEVCGFVQGPDGPAMEFASLTYNTYLDRYMAVGIAGEAVCGVYFSTSLDLIHWSEAQLIAEALTGCESDDPTTPGLLEIARIGYPSIIDHADSTTNFERPGRFVYLYYTRFNEDYWLNRDLIRVPLTFTLGGALCEGVDCDDQNECTQDVCNGADGSCEHPPVDCVGDFNDCTVDTCTPGLGCNATAADATPCAGGTCQAGACELTGSVLPCTEQGIRNAIAAGGGPYTFSCGGPTTVVTQAEIVIDNSVILDGEGKLTVDGNTGHRVFSVAAGVAATLMNVTVTGGADVLVGGGILNEGTLMLTGSTITGNTANRGGGVANQSTGTLTVTNCTVSENTGGAFAGGLRNVGLAEVFDTTVSNNTATQNSGGVANRPGATMTLIRTTVEGNIAGVTSGGLGNNGTLTVINTTVSGNEAGETGGGITNNGTLTLVSTTVSGNAAPVGGANILNGGAVSARNVIIDGQCQGPPLIDSLGGNIESPGNTCFTSHPADQVSLPTPLLLLGPLQDNGGPTQTHALLPGSVAVDWIPGPECVDAEGAPLTTDQRGFPRDSMCDVGAFEVQP